MATYNPKVIQRYADALYSKANWMVIRLVALGLVLGGVGGGFIDSAMRSGNHFMAITLGGLGVLLGLAIGSSLAFSLRLRAQLALCVLQTEFNTRSQPPSPSAPSALPPRENP